MRGCQRHDGQVSNVSPAWRGCSYDLCRSRNSLCLYQVCSVPIRYVQHLCWPGERRQPQCRALGSPLLSGQRGSRRAARWGCRLSRTRCTQHSLPALARREGARATRSTGLSAWANRWGGSPPPDRHSTPLSSQLLCRPAARSTGTILGVSVRRGAQLLLFSLPPSCLNAILHRGHGSMTLCFVMLLGTCCWTHEGLKGGCGLVFVVTVSTSTRCVALSSPYPVELGGSPRCTRQQLASCAATDRLQDASRVESVWNQPDAIQVIP